MGTWHAWVALAPHLRASSRLATLMIQKPPTCSLPSANGPSVVSTSPFLTRRVVAVLEGNNPPPNTQAPAFWISALSASTSAPIAGVSSFVHSWLLVCFSLFRYFVMSVGLLRPYLYCLD